MEQINEAFKWVKEALIGASKMGQHFQCQNYREVARMRRGEGSTLTLHP